MKFFISSREFKRLLIFMPLGWVTRSVNQPKGINRYGEVSRIFRAISKKFKG